MKFEENLRWWVHWLGHLTENDSKQKNFLDFKSSVTEAFIKRRRHNFQTNAKPSLELKSGVFTTWSCKFWGICSV